MDFPKSFPSSIVTKFLITVMTGEHFVDHAGQFASLELFSSRMSKYETTL